MFSGKNYFKIFTIIKNSITKFSLFAVSVVAGFVLVLVVNNYFNFLPEIQLHDYSPQEKPDEDIGNDIIIPQPPVADEPEYTYADFINQCESIDMLSGFSVSDLAYNAVDFKIVKVSGDLALPKYYSVSDIIEGSGNEEEAALSYPRPALHPRMGFIVMQKEDLSFSLLNYNGTLLCNLPSETVLLPVRDSDGNPVFSTPDGYFYFSREENAFLPSSYNPDFDVHGVEADMPSYYDMPTDTVYRYHGEKKNSWGFINEEGNTMVANIYNFAYQFSQGYGAVRTNNGRVFLHDRYGYSRFTDHTFYNTDYKGIENSGFYSFDRGLMRVREERYNWRGEMLSEHEYVTHLANTEFFIPKDYKIISYFDGIFLLEKDGKYGYFNYLGEWVCQPIYTYASPFIEGLGVVGYKDGKKGVVDETGNFVVPMLFDEIAQCSGGIMTLFDKNGGWFILNKVKYENDSPLLHLGEK